MQKAKAISKYIRISPLKARLAANLIRGKKVTDAKAQLEFSGLKAGRQLKKTLDSAVANMELQFEVKREQMVVSEVRVDEGPRMKRAKARNKGGRSPILKRMSHFTVVVEGQLKE
ncbi:MAG: 50S ribosomal protein L22 [Chlamydiae bacterium]|nr:50S ribosomal protein L22 [Chlamydiota bacterium]